MLPYDITTLSDFNLTDSGDPATGRFVIEAIASDPNDTSKAAYIHVSSHYQRNMAELVLKSLLEFKASFKAVETILEHSSYCTEHNCPIDSKGVCAADRYSALHDKYQANYYR